MFLVLLRFSHGKSRAGELMAAHREWIQRGFDDGVFLLVGGIRPEHGGVVIAVNTTRAVLQARVLDDPFVVHDVVAAELLEISASRADPRLVFLLT